MKPRRCELSVPSSSLKMIKKAASLRVDEVILDLEDSIAPDGRNEARQNIIQAAHELDWTGKRLAWRINAVSTPFFYQDLLLVAEAAGDKLDAVIIPKVNRPEEVYTVAALLRAVEATKNLSKIIKIEVQIESAEGMQNVGKIAQVAPGRLEALIFGPGDYAASIGMPSLTIGSEAEGYNGHIWHYPLSQLIVAGRANQLEIIDGPYATFKDTIGLRKAAQAARLLGCDGKWAIHPDQIETIQTNFTPSQAEIEQAQHIMDGYNAAIANEKRGVTQVDGDMVDAATIKMAQRILSRAIPKV